MSLLTDDEIDALGLGSATRADVRDVEAALLAKLAVMELPETVVIDRHIPTGTVIRGYTADQLRQAYAQGAASVLSAEPSDVFTKINGEWVSGKPGNKEPS